MNIMSVITSLYSRNKRINTKELPSMGLFYPPDLKIYIGKCTTEDILAYEEHYDPNNVLSIVYCMKTIVDKCITLNKNYTKQSIKSIDMLYIFLEIVKHTTNKPIIVPFYDDVSGMQSTIEMNSSTFDYMDMSELMQYYKPDTREFEINGYRLSLPSKGVENSLTEYLSRNVSDESAHKLSSYSYDFIYFLGNRNMITFDEIDNLIELFNDDMSEDTKIIVSDIVVKFSKMISYNLIKNGRQIELRSKIKMSTIWK